MTLKSDSGRRDFLKKLGLVTWASSSAAYLSLAPSHWPLSRLDPQGKRVQLPPQHFLLPDFRVPAKSQFAVGVGRSGTTAQNLAKALDAIGGITHYIQPGDIVLIKPNVAFDRAPALGATTNPLILKALIKMLYVDCRAKEVRVADNPIESPADCFMKSRIQEATLKAGGSIFLPDSNSFALLRTEQARLIGLWPFFARPFKHVNKVIGLSPVKDHNLCQASMGIKNWYGLLGGARNTFHQDIHEIVSDLTLMLKPTLTILDGSFILMENGPTGGDPSNVKQGNVVVAGTDPVALDTYAFVNILERKQSLPHYLTLAEKKGSGKRDYKDRIKEII